MSDRLIDLSRVPVLHMHREFLDAFEKLMEALKGRSGYTEREHFGGQFCVSDENGNAIFMRGYGTVPEEFSEKYVEFAREKAKRLAKNSNHDTSAQSRDHTRHLYEGAVRVKGYIFSFSGMEPQLDEAIVLFLAVKTYRLEYEKALRIACDESRPIFKKLFTDGEVRKAFGMAHVS